MTRPLIFKADIAIAYSIFLGIFCLLFPLWQQAFASDATVLPQESNAIEEPLPYGCGHLCVYVVSNVLGLDYCWETVSMVFAKETGADGELSFAAIGQVVSENFGWHTKAFRMEPSSLHHLTCPVIALLHPLSQERRPHFVVLVPLTGGRIQLIDLPNHPQIMAPEALSGYKDYEFRGEVLLLDTKPIRFSDKENRNSHSVPFPPLGLAGPVAFLSLASLVTSKHEGRGRLVRFIHILSLVPFSVGDFRFRKSS